MSRSGAAEVESIYQTEEYSTTQCPEWGNREEWSQLREEKTADRYAETGDLSLQSKPMSNLLPHQGQPYQPSRTEDQQQQRAPTVPPRGAPETEITVPDLVKLLKEAGSAVGTFAFKEIRRITKTGDQAIVLCQCLYWFDRGKGGKLRARVEHNGIRYVAKTHGEMADETGLTERQAGEALKWLKTKKFIKVSYHMFSGVKTTHIHVKAQAIYDAMHARAKKGQ